MCHIEHVKHVGHNVGFLFCIGRQILESMGVGLAELLIKRALDGNVGLEAWRRLNIAPVYIGKILGAVVDVNAQTA